VYLQMDTLYEYHRSVVGSRSDRECGQPIWARTKDAPRPALSRASIVAAAIAIADAEGIDAVSIRRVAAELGTRAMSLYTYIARKEDLLDLMGDEINAELVVEGELPAHWRDAISEISRLTLHTMLRHPWAVDLKGRRLALGPNGLRHADQSLEALSGLGLANKDVYAVMRSIDEYVLGYGVHESTARTRNDEVHLREYFDEVAAGGEYPYLAPLLRDGMLSKEHTFERGLKWLLDGIEREFGSNVTKLSGT
jgi:AcrR family transcriptional regulator